MMISTRAIPLAAVLAMGCGNSLRSTGERDSDTDDGGGDSDGTVTCTSDPECDDGNPCNGEETCESGSCRDGTPLSDGAPCEEGGVAGTCRDEECVPLTCGDGALDEGEECDDGNDTSGDGCEDDCSFSCHEPADCDDSNVCTDDSCVEGGRGRLCSYAPNTDPCDDLDPCTSPDVCSGGACVPGENTCDCLATEDCAAHEDGNLCNGTLVCDLETHLCEVDPGTVITCSPTATLCHVLVCVPETGDCVDDNPPSGTACEDDSDACTEDECDGVGHCVHETIVCTDGNDCTTDSCDPSSGCVFAPLTGGSCSDGDACTVGDHCVSGACTSGSPKDCGDGDVCTDDGCTPSTGACTHTFNTDPCDDGDPCTSPDTCYLGSCSGLELPVWYLDGDGDGHGDLRVSICATTAPSGYVASHDDCCDTNVSVFTGQGSWFTTAYTCGTGGSPTFDYNCNGLDERHWTAIGSCTWDSTSGTCIHVAGWSVPSGTGAPACGVLGTWLGGCLMGAPGVCSPGAVTDRRQECH
jgi:cysteine-rich repeat protein